MKTSLEKLDGLLRSLTVELPIEDFNQKVDAVLKKMASQASIDGFRKGKVPVAMLRKRFGANAKNDASSELVGETLGEALKDAQATPAHQPALTKVDDSGDVFVYTVEFEVYPEISVGDFKELAFEQTKVKITKADEKSTMDGLQEQQTEFKPVKRKSKEGDRLTINFKGFVDGEAFDGGESEGYTLILGKGSMIPGFEDGLVDVAAGKSTKVEVTFPEQYQAPQLAGKDAVFEVDVTEVASPKSPKLDDEFAKKFGEDNMEALTKSVKEQMRSEIDGRLHNLNKDAVFNALLAANEFEVPKSVIAQEAENLKQDMEARMQQQGMDPKAGNIEADMFNGEAERRVKLGLLVSQVASDNRLEASKEQVEEKLQEMSQAYGEQAQQMVDYYNINPQMLQSIELLVVEKMVMDLVTKDAKVTDVNKKFSEVAAMQA